MVRLHRGNHEVADQSAARLNLESFLALALVCVMLQRSDRFLHFAQVSIGRGIVRDVPNDPILVDKKTDPPGHVLAGHSHTIGIGNSAFRIDQEREIQLVLAGELLMAFGLVEANSNDLHIAFLEIAHLITQSTRFLRTTWRIVFRVEIEKDRLFV